MFEILVYAYMSGICSSRDSVRHILKHFAEAID